MEIKVVFNFGKAYTMEAVLFWVSDQSELTHLYRGVYRYSILFLFEWLYLVNSYMQLLLRSVYVVTGILCNIYIGEVSGTDWGQNFLRCGLFSYMLMLHLGRQKQVRY